MDSVFFACALLITEFNYDSFKFNDTELMQ